MRSRCSSAVSRFRAKTTRRPDVARRCPAVFSAPHAGTVKGVRHDARLHDRVACGIQTACAVVLDLRDGAAFRASGGHRLVPIGTDRHVDCSYRVPVVYAKCFVSSPDLRRTWDSRQANRDGREPAGRDPNRSENLLQLGASATVPGAVRLPRGPIPLESPPRFL